MHNTASMRNYREKQGLRQIDVALKAGISIAWVRHAESTNGVGVSPRVKQKIANAIGVRPEEIFAQ